MVQLEGIDRLCVPDPQAVDHVVAVAHHRKIHRHRQHRLIALLDETALAVLVLNPDVTSELDRLGILRTAKLERIAVLQPHIRNFHLITVLNFLFEHAVAVADAAAVRRIAQRRQRIQKAGCQTSQAAVSKRRIRLLILDHVQIQADLLQRVFHLIIEGQVDQVVAQSPSHQELHGHVVYDLRIVLLVFLLRRNPCIHDCILHCITYRLKDLLLSRFLNLFAEQRTYIILYASDKKILVKSSFGHRMPPFTAFLHPV